MYSLCEELILGARIAQRELKAEIRNKLRNFWVFLVCIILGVAAIASVGGLKDSLQAGLKSNSKNLLGGDVEIRLSHKPISEKQLNYLKNNSQKISKIIKMRTMTRSQKSNNHRTLTELKAVDNAYPLSGKLVLNPNKDINILIGKSNEIWGSVVEKSLLTKLNAKLGDLIVIGSTLFQIRATIISEPDRIATGFNFGPSALISSTALMETGLIQPGSQTRYHYRIILPKGEKLEGWKNKIQTNHPSTRTRIRGPEDATQGARQFIKRMGTFFSFVSLTVLFIGGLGVNSAVKNYLNSKIKTIATFKCLGASESLVFKIYLFQVLALGAFGVLIGLMVGALTPVLLLSIFQDSLPIKPLIKIFIQPLLIATFFGLLSIFTVALWPIGQYCKFKPGSLFRAKTDPLSEYPKRIYLFATIVGVSLIGVLCIITIENHFFTYCFIFGAILMFLILHFCARMTIKLATMLPLPSNTILRLVQSNLHRPGTVFPAITVSIGSGLSVLIAIALVQENLSDQITKNLPEKAPAFFFIDIQPNQVSNFDTAIKSIKGTRNYQRVPTLRGRIVKINGEQIELSEIPEESHWAIRGDRALTYSAKQTSKAEIVAGKWWSEDYHGKPLISLDSKLAKSFNVTVGDNLTINILGKDVKAEIANLRKINWRKLQFDFAIIFAPGTLENAPLTYMAAVEVPIKKEEELEKAATHSFPNVSAIRVRNILESASKVLYGIKIAIQGTAILTLLIGTIVLSSIMIAEHQRRLYESVIFKMLGATRPQIISIYFIEYSIVGLLTGIIAALIGSLIGWAIIEFLLQFQWVFSGEVLIYTTCISTLTVATSGLVTSWHILGQKTTPFLRND